MDDNPLSKGLVEILRKINSESKSEEIRQEEHTEIKDEEIETLRKKEEISALSVANNLRREELESRKQDRSQRKRYADYLFVFLCTYMLLVFAILILSGFCDIRFRLNDSVIIALITTTTANIIGIFIFVVKYLFKSSED